jgi:hypothetical protein
MPCEEHEPLNQDWELKWRAEISAHDGYKGSIKSVLIERSRTNSETVQSVDISFGMDDRHRHAPTSNFGLKSLPKSATAITHDDEHPEKLHITPEVNVWNALNAAYHCGR